MRGGGPALRYAGADDAALIAAMHAASWRSAYRDIMAADWLANNLDADRLAIWTARLRVARPDMCVLILEQEDEAIGFACVMAGDDARWGSLLDNLHVLPGLKGGGHGKLLLRAAARWAAEAAPGAGLHLFCYTDNHGARRFYDHLGGQVVEALEKPAPDGRIAAELRYYWSDALALGSG
jgi:GNAT superfamily N-acetyltransferase